MFFIYYTRRRSVLLRPPFLLCRVFLFCFLDFLFFIPPLTRAGVPWRNGNLFIPDGGSVIIGLSGSLITEVVILCQYTIVWEINKYRICIIYLLLNSIDSVFGVSTLNRRCSHNNLIGNRLKIAVDIISGIAYANGGTHFNHFLFECLFL